MKDSNLSSVSKKDFETFSKNVLKKIERLTFEFERIQKVVRFEVMSNTLNVRQQLERQISEFKDELFTRIDPLLSEIENSRIDREISTVQLEELKENIKVLEKRINKLETQQLAS